MTTRHMPIVMFALMAAHAEAAALPPTTPPLIPPAVIPNRPFDITHFGAVPDGKTLCTKPIADTIAAATAAGGGTVVVPAGNFLVGRIVLASNLELRLEKDARLLLTDDLEAYRNARGTLDNCITAENCHDLAITGQGTIDGQGEPWWVAFRKVKGTPEQAKALHRPYLIKLVNCTRLHVADVTLMNSPSFHLVPQSCTDVTIENVHFKAPADAPNTDALDPSGWNFSITRCTFDTGDDCIAIKASGQPSATKLSCEDFYVADCTFLHGHGLSIGGQTPGGLRRLTVRHCTFENTDAGIRMKASRGSGGLVEQCTYDDLTMKHVKVPIYITSYYPKTPDDAEADPAQPVTPTTPIWRDIRISNLSVTDSPEAGRILGLPEMPVGHIVFENVHISAKTGLTVINAANVEGVRSYVHADIGPSVKAVRSNVTGLD